MTGLFDFDTVGPMETTHYELEERTGMPPSFGQGTWRPVYQDKVEADYEMPNPVTFQTKEEARDYAEAGGRGKWSPGGLTRGFVRIVAVRTTRTHVEF